MKTTDLNQTIKPTFNLLKLTYGIVPIVAGLDKFSNMLVQWDSYLNPQFAEMLPFAPATFMMIVGVIEIAAGVMVFMKPAIGGYVVAAWLTLIALTLVGSGKYFDIAVRDLVMAVGAFSMARIAKLVS